MKKETLREKIWDLTMLYSTAREEGDDEEHKLVVNEILQLVEEEKEFKSNISLKEAKEIAKISGKIQMPKEKPPEDWEKEYKERFAFPVSNADNPTIYYKEKWIDQRDIEIIDFIRQLLTQQKQKWDKDHELLVNAIIDTYKMKIKDLKQQYRQEILEGLPKEKELENENIAGLTNARTRNDQKTGYNQALQEIRELINKI